MNLAPTEMSGFREILVRKQAELIRVLRKRDDIAIEKSADQMDEIQYASERDMAIRNVDRDSALLRQVKASLRRIHDGSFGICIECEEAISPKRLAAVPWAPRCYPLPERCRSRAAGEHGILRRASRQCRVNELFCGGPSLTLTVKATAGYRDWQRKGKGLSKIVRATSSVRNIAFLGDYLPRKCGIATFTSDLLGAVAERHSESRCFAVPVNDIEGYYQYPDVVRSEIEEQVPASYRRAADFLNTSNVDVVSLQHEFGIFGGPAGSYCPPRWRPPDTPARRPTY